MIERIHELAMRFATTPEHDYRVEFSSCGISIHNRADCAVWYFMMDPSGNLIESERATAELDSAIAHFESWIQSK